MLEKYAVSGDPNTSESKFQSNKPISSFCFNDQRTDATQTYENNVLSLLYTKITTNQILRQLEKIMLITESRIMTAVKPF